MEESVETNLAVEEDIAAARTVSNDEVMVGLKRIVEIWIPTEINR